MMLYTSDPKMTFQNMLKYMYMYTEQNYKRPMWHFETFISLRGCKIY